MGLVFRNPARMAQAAIADAWEPAPPVDYLAWAKKNIKFSKRESESHGAYDAKRFAYFDEPLNALSPDDPCRIVTLKKSAQIGGTVLANIFVGGSMDMDPRDILYTHPTEDNARRWSKMKFAPMLKGTDALKAIFPMRPRDGLDSVLYKERKDGRGAILISGANSPASLSQVSMPRQVQDDLSKWEVNVAGDPETQADARSRAYTFAKLFKVSTPLVTPGCRITDNFDQGSQEYPYVPCPDDDCGHMQVLEWENMLDNLDEEHPEKAHFTCPECGGVIEDSDREKMIAGVEWRAKNPDAMRYHRSFYLWSAYSMLQSFEMIARDWIKAKGDPASEKTFWNDVLGKAYRILGEAPPWETLRDRAEESHYARGIIPAGFVLVTIGVDCQKDRVEVQTVAFGPNKQRAVIDYEVIDGHISEPECQAALDKLIAKPIKNVHGRAIVPDLTAIDGNAWTEEVWAWAKRHPASTVIMVRGNPGDGAPLFAKVKKERNRRGKLLRYSSRFFNFGASVLKMALMRNLMKDDPEASGYVFFPRGLEDDYFRQLTSESRKPEKNRRGFTRYVWVKAPNQPNEGLDTMNQAEAAAIRIGIRHPQFDWDTLLAERDCAPEEEQADFEDLLLGGSVKPEPDSDQKKSARERRKEKWGKRG